MIADVAVLIPVLGRPERVEPLMRSLRSSQRVLRLEPMFACSGGDRDQIDAVKETGYRMVMVEGPYPGDYALKMEVMAEVSGCPWLFLAADDLCFCEGWADEAVAEGLRRGKRVIGTNDLGNPDVVKGRHSTHTMIHRSYVEEHGTWDDPQHWLHLGYHHNFVDTELIETAKARDEFVAATGAHVEHLHPHWKKGEMDATYERGLSHFEADQRLFVQRRRTLWGAQGARG